MPKLFVAVDLPEAAKRAILGLQPPAEPGVRLPDSSQLHLTLHYIGEADLARMASALGEVAPPAFSVDLRGVGQFVSPDGSVTAWAGIAPSPRLLALHMLVASALAREGFIPEARPYSPHVTIAWWGPGSARRGIDGLIAAHTDFSLHGLQLTEFGLYSSTFVDGIPSYRREQAFPLS